MLIHLITQYEKKRIHKYYHGPHQGNLLLESCQAQGGKQKFSRIVIFI